MSEPRVHLAFPFRIGQHGRCELAQGLDEHVRDELLQLILTGIGERLMLPELGTTVRRLTFENADETSRAMAKATIAQAISRWLGQRVVLDDLIVGGDTATIDILIRYRPVGGETRTLQFQRSL